jgi:GPI mannosyltransferase 3
VAFPRALLWLVLVLGAALRLHLAITDDGLYWPDEIYQSLEPAHRLVFGYGLTAWEFIEGARNWALPGLVAGVMKISTLFGDSSTVYLFAVKLFFGALSLISAWGVFRLARVHGADELSAVSGAAIWSLASLAIYFAPRAMAENACTPPLLWGLVFCCDKQPTRNKTLLGAGLLGLATMLRLQCAVVCVTVLVFFFIQVLRKKYSWVRLGDLFGAFAISALAYGALDAATWSQAPNTQFHGWFHSAIVYLRFNLIENKAAQWGTAPFMYYVEHLWACGPGLCLFWVLGVLVGLRRALLLNLVVLVFLGLHFKTGHKELRFILPMLPLLCALVGLAVSQWRGHLKSIVVAAVFALSVWSAWGHRTLTMGDLGSYPERAQASAYDDFGNVIRLMKIAGQRSDVCGLRVDVAHPAWTGGYSALHKNIGYYFPGTPDGYHWFNAVITLAGSGYPVLASDKGLELVKLPYETCQPNPNYSWRLP